MYFVQQLKNPFIISIKRMYAETEFKSKKYLTRIWILPHKQTVRQRIEKKIDNTYPQLLIPQTSVLVN